MSEAPPLFRPAALDAAADDAAFDDALRIVRPGLWAAALVLAGLIVIAVGWSAIFRIPITVAGRGILLAQDGVVDVASDGGGQIVRLLARPGDTVRQGQVVAQLSQPDVRLKLSLAQGELADARQLMSDVRSLQGVDSNATARFRRIRSASLGEKIEALSAQRQVLAERLAAMQQLAAKSLITRERLMDASLALVNMDGQIAEARNERSQMLAQAETSHSDQQRELIETMRRLSDAERNVSALREQLARTGVIRSAFSGRVVEVKANVGQVINAGTPVLTLERTAARPSGTEPVGILFVSAADGKKLRKGMKVRIAPATGKSDEQGFLLGTVNHVSDTPASSAGMFRRLQNDQLVQTFTQALGAPFEVEVSLQADPQRSGRLLWSTGSKPVSAIDSGTLIDGTITIRDRSLLSLAIPALQYGPAETGPEARP